MTLEELVIAVERHRQQMAPLVAGLSVAIDDAGARELVGLLEDSDRELDRLCHQLSQHLGRLEVPIGRQEPPPWHQRT